MSYARAHRREGIHSKIKLKDKVTQYDTKTVGGFRGEVIFGTGKKLVPYTNPYGQISYLTTFKKELYRDENIVPIGGYQFTFCKLFNIGLDQESTLRIGDLNDEAPQMKIGVPREEYISPFYNAEVPADNSSLLKNAGVNISALNFVIGFMMGDGGARQDNMTAIAPNYKRRNLYKPIPFRMSNDGFVMPTGKYYGKLKTYQGSGSNDMITSYYVKLFDDPSPRIVHVWATDNANELSIVDDTVFASTSSVPIESYVEINMSLDEYDGRGYATTTGSTPRVNEFGLVSGWYNSAKDDFESLRLFTHFTRPSIVLAEGDEIEAVYRIYAR